MSNSMMEASPVAQDVELAEVVSGAAFLNGDLADTYLAVARDPDDEEEPCFAMSAKPPGTSLMI